MIGVERTLNVLLQRYPNASEILKELGYINPQIIEKPADLVTANYAPSPTNEIISSLLESLSHVPLTENIYPALCDGLDRYLQKKIKVITAYYSHILADQNVIAASLAQQSIDNLSDAVKQLCLFCSRLNQSEEYRIAGWLEMFNIYPLIAQRIESHVDHTLKVIGDILSTLENDQQQLINRFNIKEYTVITLELFLGDFHQSGKSIVKVKFARNTLIYKPRSANNEMLVNKIMADLYPGRDDAKPGIPQCLSINDHSWHEYIEFTEAGTTSDVLTFYRKIGKSLALFYCLNGTDFHFENIIYSKGTPWFIDLECLFTISIRPDFITDSVLNSLIIPTLQGAAFDTQICGIGTKGTMVNKLNAEMSEEGKVYLKVYPIKLGGGNNTPGYREEKLNERIINEVIEGYDEMISLLREKRSIQHSIKKSSGLRGRILFRATRVYGDILAISNHPAYLSIPQLRDIYIACALYHESIPIEVIRQEYLSLRDGKIPVFYVDLLNEKCYSIDGTEINAGDILLNSKEFITKPYRVTTEEETVLQKALINISLRTLFPNADDSQSSLNDIDSLVDFITQKSCRCNQKDIYLNLKREMNDSRAIASMRGDIYNGLGGALFLQICNFIAHPSPINQNKLKELYKATPNDDASDYFGCFDSSNGGMLYNEYLLIKHAPGLIDNALFYRRLLDTVHRIHNKSDANNDILAGIAGILIVSCRMHQILPCKQTEVAINMLSRKLRAQARTTAQDSVSWGRGWTGFSHGNAGIIYALTLANNLLKDADIDKLIIKALRYENAFRIDSGWNDIATYNTGKDYNSWCHGATGIYLSRRAMLKEMKSKNSEIIDMLNSDIAHYHHTQANRPAKDHLSLCHGTFGNAIIDPDRYGTHFDTHHLRQNILEEKSLMLGAIGAIYSNFYFSHADKAIPNLLLLE